MWKSSSRAGGRSGEGQGNLWIERAREIERAQTKERERERERDAGRERSLWQSKFSFLRPSMDGAERGSLWQRIFSFPRQTVEVRVRAISAS